jgi:hypothetical protein
MTDEESKVASECLHKAYQVLRAEYDEWSLGDAIELAKLMNEECNFRILLNKMDDVVDAIYAVKNAVKEDAFKEDPVL